MMFNFDSIELNNFKLLPINKNNTDKGGLVEIVYSYANKYRPATFFDSKLMT